MPSFWSSVANSAWKTRRSNATPSASEISKARFTASFAAITEGSDIAAIVSAVFIAVGEKVGGRHDAGDEAGALGLRRVHHPPGEDQVHRLRLADGAGQALGAADARNDAELDLRLAELRGVGGDDDVALHGELAAAAERKARDRRNHRLAGMGEAVPGGGEVPHERVHVGLARHLLDVGAGGERLLRPGDDEAADPGVRLERIDCGAISSIIAELSALSAFGRLSRISPTRPLVSTMMFWWLWDMARPSFAERPSRGGKGWQSRRVWLTRPASPSPSSGRAGWGPRA